MRIADLAETDVLTAAPDTTVGEMATAMRDHDADVVAVLDEGRPLGLITAADLGRAFVAGEDLESMVATDLVDGDPPTVPASADRAALISLLEADEARRAIVVDEAGAFVGVATLDAAIASYGRELLDVLELLE